MMAMARMYGYQEKELTSTVFLLHLERLKRPRLMRLIHQQNPMKHPIPTHN